MFYALGDIHGQKAQLDRALALIENDGGAGAEIFFVGDLVDRGPDSRAVIQMIMDGQNAGKPWSCILGNHDYMFHQFVQTGRVLHSEIKSSKSWLHQRLGGVTTLASYMRDQEIDHPDWVSWDHAIEHGLDPASPSFLTALSQTAQKVIPSNHLDWIASLPLFVEAPDNHMIVHAGIRPGVAMRDQTHSDLTWIRDGWLDDCTPHEFMFVHGHTALEFPQHHGNRINIDGGAAFGRPLVPCGFDGKNWFTLDETGRSSLRPVQSV